MLVSLTASRVKSFRDVFGSAKASPMQTWPYVKSNWRNAGKAEKGRNEKTGLTARGLAPLRFTQKTHRRLGRAKVQVSLRKGNLYAVFPESFIDRVIQLADHIEFLDGIGDPA
ncbi:MAG: hypothetical protein PWP34_2614 [Desulfuromonadales bacterium]|nr:hypothetical protein [Desulfuromonadales bacterium]